MSTITHNEEKILSSGANRKAIQLDTGALVGRNAYCGLMSARVSLVSSGAWISDKTTCWQLGLRVHDADSATLHSVRA